MVFLHRTPEPPALRLIPVWVSLNARHLSHPVFVLYYACATLSNPPDGDMNEKIQSVLNSLPHKPGIYLMKDAEGTIIYVGKVISLFNRVRSYFEASIDL